MSSRSRSTLRITLLIALASLGLAVGLMFVGHRLWGRGDLLDAFRRVLASSVLLPFVLVLCAIPFAAAGALGAIVLRRRPPRARLRMAAWISMAATAGGGALAEVLTWRAIFEGARPLTAIAFFILPFGSVLCAAVVFAMATAAATAAARLRRPRLASPAARVEESPGAEARPLEP